VIRKFVRAAAVLLAGCSAEAQTLDEALNAYSHNKVAEAERAFTKIAADPAAKPGDKARAFRELARIAWLVDGNASAALAAAARADATGEGSCDIAMLRARILQQSDADAVLVEEAALLAGRCTDPVDAGKIRLHAVRAALDVASADRSSRPAAVATAKRLLGETHEDVRGGLEGSAAALQVALLASDAAGALQAWKDYFWLTGADVPQGLRQAYPAAAPIFAAALAASAAPEDRLRLVDLLVRGGFAQAGERFAASTGLTGAAAEHPLWRKASGYFEARRELEAAILASNRRVARGGKAADLEAAVSKARAKLMAAAGVSGEPEPALRQAYGLFGQVGNTDGHASVHYGHVVQDERRLIEQYGHRASVAFIALDNMISNGFNSWLWDGSAAAGGWTSPGPVIVQVRPEYTSNPLNAWSLFNGGPGRERMMAREKERAAADLTILGTRDVAYLPGLADRLRMQVAQQVGAQVKTAAGESGDLRRAFLEEYWRATFQQSILSHEGRHALDRKLVTGLARLNDSNLEFRAKLSELALAEYPRLALLNINDSTIGSDNGHGKANEKLLRAYRDSMRKNPRQVRGYDPNLPALVQIDRLSDDQLRAVARSLDPIAPK